MPVSSGQRLSMLKGSGVGFGLESAWVLVLKGVTWVLVWNPHILPTNV